MVHQLEARAPRNKVTVAVAYKVTRIVCAMLSKGGELTGNGGRACSLREKVYGVSCRIC